MKLKKKLYDEKVKLYAYCADKKKSDIKEVTNKELIVFLKKQMKLCF